MCHDVVTDVGHLMIVLYSQVDSGPVGSEIRVVWWKGIGLGDYCKDEVIEVVGRRSTIS